jgi:large subunit ribosomal protein L6
MSRVGRKPIPIPDNTKILYKDRVITVQGEKGTLTRTVHPDVDLKIEDRVVNVTMKKDDRSTHAIQGLVRSLVANMIAGVSKGFERILEINGIGYRAEVKGKNVVFNLGYSHPITFDIPEDIGVH